MYTPFAICVCSYYMETLKSTKSFPSEADEKRVRLTERVGWGNVTVEGNRFSKKKHGVEVDLGGVAKGWAIDRMIKRLQDGGFTDCFVEWVLHIT